MWVLVDKIRVTKSFLNSFIQTNSSLKDLCVMCVTYSWVIFYICYIATFWEGFKCKIKKMCYIYIHNIPEFVDNTENEYHEKGHCKTVHTLCTILKLLLMCHKHKTTRIKVIPLSTFNNILFSDKDDGLKLKKLCNICIFHRNRFQHANAKLKRLLEWYTIILCPKLV